MRITPRVIEVPDTAAKRNADEALIHAEALALDIEKLYMITQALWTIVKQQGNLDDKPLLDLIKAIGGQDGRRKREERPGCAQCGRKMISKSSLCLYCGAAAELDPFKKY